MYNAPEPATEYQSSQNSKLFAIDGSIFSAVVIIALVLGVIFGIIAAIVAKDNERSATAGFFTGFFFGPLGVMTYMIMGESVELRAYLFEKERRSYKPSKD